MKGSNRNLMYLLVISVGFNLVSIIDSKSFGSGDMVITNLRVGEPEQTVADVYMIGKQVVPFIPLPWKTRATLLEEGLVIDKGEGILLFKE